MRVVEEHLGEELYNLLAELLNSKMNRTVLDSIRGEYGVLRYLYYVQDHVHAGTLTAQLHVVPGRMTDILNSLETKGWIRRDRDEEDRRRVNVCITEEGRKQAVQMREMIHREYRGMYDILGAKDTQELIRLLKVVLAYPQSPAGENAAGH
jgi:DNA-binding MarR family transcriptional regulator